MVDDFLTGDGTTMAPRPALDRLKARPDPGSWADDELVSLSEAVALFMPHGPLTAAALRTAYRRGKLAAREVCGRILTTRRHLDAMTAPRLLAPANDAGDESAPPRPHLSPARPPWNSPAGSPRRGVGAARDARLRRGPTAP